MILWPVTCRLDASVAVAFKAAVSREIFAANDRVTLRFIDAGEIFPAERLALARIPAAFSGPPIAFVLASLMSLAFMGFSGLNFK